MPRRIGAIVAGFVVVVVTLALLPAPSPATLASQAGEAPQKGGPLQAFAFLAGSCWEGRFPNKETTDEHCFEWLHDGAFLRDRHVVRGDATPYSGETTYAWDAQAGRIVYWYIASTGSFSTGTAEARGDAIVFPESHVSSRGEVMEILNTWTRTGRDTYHVRAVRKTNEGEQEMWSMEMRRRSDRS